MLYCPRCDKDYPSGSACPVDQTPLVSQAVDLLVGKVILGRYQIDGKVARGGMGTVYRGHILKSGLTVAIKVLHENLQDSPDDVRRFFREAANLSEVKHRNVVSLIDSGQTESGRVFLVLEYLFGQTLTALVQAEGRLPLQMAMSVMFQALDGARAAHARGIVHRDLTPMNIIIARLADNTECVKIVDFGIAKSGEVAAQVTQNGATVGTPGFLSPEQILGRTDVDVRSDVYSLGAVLYYLLTGTQPFPGPHAAAILTKQMSGTIEPIDCAALGVSPALGKVIVKALSPEPEQRYQSALELREALQQASGVVDVATNDLGERFNHQLQVYRRTRPGANVSNFGASLGDIAAQARAVRSRRISYGVAVAIVVAALGIAALYLSFSKPKPQVAAAPAPAPIAVPPIRVGLSADLRKDSAYVTGIRAAFAGVRALDAEASHRFELLVLDDAGDPAKAKLNAAELLDQQAVIALFGNTSTETSEASFAEVKRRETVYFAPMIGSTHLRKKPTKVNVFHYRPPYSEEAVALVDALVSKRGVAQGTIALFAEDTADGFSCAKGVVEALEKAGDSQAARTVVARYAPGDDGKAATKVFAKNSKRARAIVLCVDAAAAAPVIRRLDKKTLIAGTSRVDAEALTELVGGALSQRAVFSRVVPLLSDEAPLLSQFREHFARVAKPGDKANAAALEGYVVGSLMAIALKVAGREVSTQKLIEALTSMNEVQLGFGEPLHFSADEHQASKQIWLVQTDANGVLSPLEANGAQGKMGLPTQKSPGASSEL